MKSPSLFSRLALLTLVSVTACPRSFAQDVGADTVVDAPKPASVRIYPDLAYVENGSSRQKLDLYLPVPMPKETLPVIVYFHGGGWQKGSKADGRKFAFRMVAQGYAVACVDYRLTSDAAYPAQIEDSRTAIRWLRAHSTRYRFDSRHFGGMGVSAGGYLVVMLGAANSARFFDTGENLGESSALQAACDFFGPTDLLQLYETADEHQTPQAEEVAKFFGGDPRMRKDQVRAANPITYLDGEVPPFLLIHGTNDTVVAPDHSRLFYRALVQRHLPVHLHLIHEVGHTGPAFVAPDINAIVDNFFSATLKPNSQARFPELDVHTESNARKD